MGRNVIVAGGGIAGIAAALAAKRAGAGKVTLLEREYLLGGLATAGLIAIYLPLCDGRGRQVSFGLAEELLRLSILHGHEGRYPKAWLEGGTPEEKSAVRFEVQYNPWLFAIDAEELLLKEGVEILYGAGVSDVKTGDGMVRSVEITFRTGKETLEADAFVDATGDAILFETAGCPTSVFSQGNILAGWYYHTVNGENTLKLLGASDVPDEYKTEEEKNKPGRRYLGLDAHEVSNMLIDSHRVLKKDFLSHGGLTPEHRLTSIAVIPQIRMTRKIDGVRLLDDKAIYSREESSIGMIADWRKRGAAYEIPLEALYGTNYHNLYAAGRCISVTDSMWDITRVIPVCAVTGQAAGTAAALGSNDTGTVQEELVRQGVVLHFN